MAKNTNRVAGAIAYVAALGLATGAWAEHLKPNQWNLSVENPVTYAQEIFGGDNPDNLDLTLSKDNTAAGAPSGVDEQTRVELQLALPATTTVDSGGQLEVTLTLTGATFGQTVGWTDISHGTALDLVDGSQKGGNAGTDSVTFKVTNENAIDSGSDGGEIANATVRVNLGSLEDASGLAKDKATVTIGGTSVVTGGGTNNFPTKIATRAYKCHDLNTDNSATDAVTCDGDPKTSITDQRTVVSATSAVVANSAKGVAFAFANGDGGTIDITDRTKLGASATQIPLGSLTVTKGTAKDSGGVNAFSAGEGANANITVTVGGPVRDADTIYLDAGGGKGGASNDKMDAKEDLSITNGVGSRTFRLSNVASGANVYFAPGGSEAMKKGEFETDFAVEYDSTSATSPASKTVKAPLNYHGVMTEAKAYAIPNAGMNDIGNVRIKCDATGSAKCTVFLDCNGQDGMAYFGELGSTIAAGATTVLQAEAIADVLDVDSWSGRLSCDVLSDKAASAQVLVRSGDSLINNTYISDEN